jgi:hypothetical protein
MRTVFQSETYRIEQDTERGIVFLRRTQAPFSAGSLDSELAAVTTAMRKFRGMKLLVDVRLAPGNNAPAFEKRIHSFRTELAGLFPVVATLVATAAGRLQIGRMNRERGDRRNSVFVEEGDAVEYLLSS